MCLKINKKNNTLFKIIKPFFKWYNKMYHLIILFSVRLSIKTIKIHEIKIIK